MALTLEHSLHVNKFEQLKSLYGEDLPIRYYVAQVIMSGFEIEYTQEIISKIKETYTHPNSLKIITQKYIPEDLSNVFVNIWFKFQVDRLVYKLIYDLVNT